MSSTQYLGSPIASNGELDIEVNMCIKCQSIWCPTLFNLSSRKDIRPSTSNERCTRYVCSHATVWFCYIHIQSHDLPPHHQNGPLLTLLCPVTISLHGLTWWQKAPATLMCACMHNQLVMLLTMLAFYWDLQDLCVLGESLNSFWSNLKSR